MILLYAMTVEIFCRGNAWDNQSMITLGNVDGQEYRMIKMSKEKDDSGYTVEFMNHDSKGENLHTVGKVFLPSK